MGSDMQWRDTMVLDFDHDFQCSQSQLTITVFWEMVDSHIAGKLCKDPTRKLNSNPIAWRIIEVSDGLSGKQCLFSNSMEEVFFPETTVMVQQNNSFIYGSMK